MHDQVQRQAMIYPNQADPGQSLEFQTRGLRAAVSHLRTSTGVHRCRSPHGMHLDGRCWTQVNCNSNCNRVSPSGARNPVVTGGHGLPGEDVT
jgi:hypothetical protein